MGMADSPISIQALSRPEPSTPSWFGEVVLISAMYALERGDFVSKSQAAAWAEHTLPAEWIALIQHAIECRDDETVDEAALPETVRFLRFVLHRSGQ